MDLIPYVGLLELSNVPIEGRIIDPDVHDLLNGSCDVVCLPTYIGEVVHPSMMTCGVVMMIDGRRGLEMVLEPFLKGPCTFTMYTSSQSKLTHLYLYIASLLCVMLSMSLGTMRRFLMVLPSLKWTWTAILSQMLTQLMSTTHNTG